MADIFISYTSTDREWANWIGLELEVLGHTPHIDAREISRGGNIIEWIDKQLDEADHVLCVVSDVYLKKLYSSLERRGGQWAAAATRPNFVLPVFIEPCEAPILLKRLKRCDLHGLSEEDARTRLRNFLEPAAKPPSGPLPGSKKASSQQPSRHTLVAFPGKAALSNIPIRVPLHFMGRGEALTAIEAALKRYEGLVAITALHGLRGVGKTALAAAYAERHRGDYKATWWIRAEATSTMRADLVALGIRLGWVVGDDKEEQAVDRVMERLSREGEGILLIFDNAADANALDDYLPQSGCTKVLVTSNAPTWRGIAEPVEIRQWPKEIGANYLTARTGLEDRAAAEALSEALGGLPLAHAQAAAYCERLDIPLAEYRKRFEVGPVQILDDTRDAPPEYRSGLTVAKTFALAIDEAAKVNPAAEPLIVHAALLAPEAIPLFLFSEAPHKFGEPLSTALTRNGLDGAVAALRGFALIDRETDLDGQPLIRLHGLVREIALARRESEVREGMRSALIAALRQVYPGDAHSNPASWPRYALLTPHVLAICETEQADHAANVECADLLDRAAGYFHARAAYSEARLLFERALAICENVLGPEHPDTATSLNNLARLLQAQGDLAAARRCRARAGDIRGSARPAASLYRDEPRQHRPTAPGPGRPGGGATAVPARASDPGESARPAASRHRDDPQQPCPPAPGPGRPLGGAPTL